jgi:hypothetical protein
MPCQVPLQQVRPAYLQSLFWHGEPTGGTTWLQADPLLLLVLLLLLLLLAVVLPPLPEVPALSTATLVPHAPAPALATRKKTVVTEKRRRIVATMIADSRARHIVAQRKAPGRAQPTPWQVMCQHRLEGRAPSMPVLLPRAPRSNDARQPPRSRTEVHLCGRSSTAARTGSSFAEKARPPRATLDLCAPISTIAPTPAVSTPHAPPSGRSCAG